jgi:hypothetical protein
LKMSVAASSSTPRRGADIKNPAEGLMASAAEAAIGTPIPDDDAEMHDHSGMSQGFQSMKMEAPPTTAPTTTTHDTNMDGANSVGHPLRPPPGLAADPPILSEEGWWELQDLLEDQILANEAFISSGIMSGGLAGPLAARRILDNSETFQQQLLTLGFAMANPCPWRRLGIGKLEGPPPTLEFVLARGRLGLDLVALARRTSWAATAPLEDMLGDLQSAMLACEVALPEAIAERKRLRIDKGGWGRWKELDPLLDEWLVNALPRDTRLLTHLSNVKLGPGAPPVGRCAAGGPRAAQAADRQPAQDPRVPRRRTWQRVGHLGA